VELGVDACVALGGVVTTLTMAEMDGSVDACVAPGGVTQPPVCGRTLAKTST
jgi:hypothetical protein